MLVRMNVDTRWNGGPLRRGEEVDVDSATARRWLSSGLAGAPEGFSLASVSGPGENPSENEVGAIDLTGDLADVKLTELQAFAAELGLDVSKLRSKRDVADAILTARDRAQAAADGADNQTEPDGASGGQE